MHNYLPRLITGLLSLLQATSLRDRVYSQEQQIERLLVAIEDIERINANSANPNALISGICSRLR